jgi:VIT1/CCC1 family predicted Fe2+/Mn2+ transporter
LSRYGIHTIHGAGWLRAAVLGANEGTVSTASLITGVAASNSSYDSILLAGLAALALTLAWALPLDQMILGVAIGSLMCLAFLGGMAAYVGGASIFVGTVRVLFWGASAMALTAGLGRLFGVIA